MSLDHLNAGVVGQVTPTQFVQRLYQDSHVRFRLIAQFEGDNHVANVSEVRVITGSGISDFYTHCEVFGISIFESDKARIVFSAWVKNYITDMVLPK